ncbi:MAG: hypothetical protein M3P93_12815 [Actinomycetota bacterium]|nr:hypothetical protein [Actinomycetota bacterium]
MASTSPSDSSASGVAIRRRAEGSVRNDCPVHERREEGEEHQVGRQLHHRSAGQGARGEADGDEDDGVGQAGAPGQRGAEQDGGAEGEAQQGQGVGVHLRVLPRGRSPYR